MSNPTQLSDRELLSTIETLTKQERALTLSVLVHLNEVERRKLHLKLGYSSMYEYCIEHLGYSSSAAGRRMQTSRCIRRFPEVGTLLARNTVNLSTITLIAPALSEDNHADLLAANQGKSQREVERIIAGYRPPAIIPDRFKPVRVRVPAVIHSRSGSEKSPNLPEPKPAPKIKVERKLLIQFTASPEFMNMFEKIKSLMSHKLSANASFEEVFAFVMTAFLEKNYPVQREQRRTNKKKRATASGNRRHIPAATRDHVFARDGGKCTYVGKNGKRCNSTRYLQVDHIVPVARGGPSSAANLRLLCARHNRIEAERMALIQPRRRPGGTSPCRSHRSGRPGSAPSP